MFAFLTIVTPKLTICKVFVNAARDRYNEGASVVMKAALKATESTQLSISEPHSGRLFILSLS
jgi:hypothetical protein